MPGDWDAKPPSALNDCDGFIAGRFSLADGRLLRNNPTLYALADATQAFKMAREHIRVVSIGVGPFGSAIAVNESESIGRTISARRHHRGERRAH
jgi:hypothetical protein